MQAYIKIALFSNSTISIPSYKLFFILAALTVLILSFFTIKKRHLPLGKSCLILVFMALSVPIGARLLHLLTNPTLYQANPAKLYSIELNGFALMGGLILATLVGVILAWIIKYDPWPLADSVAPALGIGIAVMRIGCYLNGCCFGKMTRLPWGVKFPMGSSPYNYHMAEILEKKGFSLLSLASLPKIHPTQLYELLAALIITLIIIYLIKKESPTGVPFLTFAGLFSLFRLGNSYLRIPASSLEVAGYFYPLLYLSIAALTIILIIYRIRQDTKTEESLA